MFNSKFRIRERFKFFLERQFVKGAHYQLLLVATLIGLISLIGGVLVLPAGEPTPTFSEALWWAFLRLTDPGYLGDDEGAWRRLISTTLTVAGYVVFLGSLVAIITTWLNRKIRDLERGFTPVAANNHVIIMGWTNRTIHIVAEIFQSVGRLRHFLERHGKRTLQLIILSENVTPERHQELKDHPRIGRRAHEIILRSGDAIDQEDLRRVDSLNAAAIIFPSPSYTATELISPDIETIKALLSLNAEADKRGDKVLPFVVAEIMDESKRSAARRAYSGPLQIIASNTVISRLLTQNLRHHGLSMVYNELLSRSIGNNIFARKYPETGGRTVAQLKSAFPKAILLGVVRMQEGGFTPLLNPPGNFVVEEEDRLVLLARHSEDIAAIGPVSEENSVETVGNLPAEEHKGARKVLILGWNYHIPALIKEFGTYKNESYQLTLASMRPLKAREKDLQGLSDLSPQVQWEQIEADFVKEPELRNIDPAAFDHIILLSSDRLTDEEEADARTIVGYVLLEGILEGVAKRPQILLELSDPSNEVLIRRFRSEVIISPMVMSHLLAAIALRPELYCVFNDLFTVGEAEIIFRKPEEYGLPTTGSTRFREIEEHAARYRETVLGVYTEITEASKGPTLTLNPGRNRKLELREGVRLVVLTTAP